MAGFFLKAAGTGLTFFGAWQYSTNPVLRGSVNNSMNNLFKNSGYPTLENKVKQGTTAVDQFCKENFSQRNGPK